VRKLRSSRCYNRRLRFEELESRRVLATFMVTSLADGPVSVPGAAPGTLRQAIYDANHTAGADVIQFDAGLSGTINLSIADDTTFGASALALTSPITIQGNANGITIARNSAAGEMRLFHVFSNGDLTLDSLSLTNWITRGANGATSNGAGTEARGGAIYNEGGLHILASTLYSNQVIGGNGGSSAGGGAGLGGAIYSDSGTLTITDSTFSGNTAKSGTGATSPSSFGGAIYVRNGFVGVYSTTITNSTATTGRGLCALAQNGTATIDIWSSIIGQSDARPEARDFLEGPGENGQVIVTGGNNLIRYQGDYQSITVSTDDPMLGALANNGGPTMTHALLPGSPAINFGSNTKSLGTDQRGISYGRVVGGVADIGSFEVQSVTGPTLLGDYNSNSVVDASDYVLWRKTVGSAVSRPFVGADGDGSGAVDTPDYGVWRSHFGISAGIESSLEPAATTESAAIVMSAAPMEYSFETVASPTSKIVGMRETRTNVTYSDTSALLELCNSPSSHKDEVASGFATRRVPKQSTTSVSKHVLIDAVLADWPSAV
jgi:hypothetical protein